jgi:DNA-binding MarR family transcriptional regulator
VSKFVTDANDLQLSFKPYAGTIGWDGSGATTLNQSQTLNHVRAQGERGLTWFELAEITNWHHGTASGQLSVLDKVGLIRRLKEKRGRSSVYVLAQYANGRELAKRRQSKLTLVVDLADGVDRQTIIDYINCVALCKLEEDNKEVIGWEWK